MFFFSLTHRLNIFLRPNKTKCVFPVTCFLKLGYVGRIILLFFEIILFARWIFDKNRNFSVCHVVSRLVAPTFLLANSLISADVVVCSARTLQKHFHLVNPWMSQKCVNCTPNARYLAGLRQPATPTTQVRFRFFNLNCCHLHFFDEIYSDSFSSLKLLFTCSGWTSMLK